MRQECSFGARALVAVAAFATALSCRSTGTSVPVDAKAHDEPAPAWLDGPALYPLDAEQVIPFADAGGGVDGCVGVCNANTPSYPVVEASGGSGDITVYSTAPSSGGACNYGSTGVRYYAAANVNVAPGDGHGQWQGGRLCGQCAEVTALTSQGPRSAVVRIMDKCADTFCGMDLGGQAPLVIMADGFGRYDGRWQFVSCAGHPEVSDGPPTLYVVAGSSAWWSRVQVRNPTWAVDAIAWRSETGADGGEFPYAMDPENTFEVPAAVLGSASPSLRLTVTYRDGSIAGASLSPRQLAAAEASYPLP
jgi:hypothetical protein